MDLIWYGAFTLLVVISIASALWLILRASSKALIAQREVRLAEVKLLDKMVALLAAKDPIAFQQIQAMDLMGQYTSDYDPSDEGEIQRIHERLGERDDHEEIADADERAFLDDIFPGGGFAGTSVE